MNYWLLNASSSNCPEQCDWICITKEEYREQIRTQYVSKCVSYTEHLFCNDFLAIFLSFITFAINMITYACTFCFAKSQTDSSIFSAGLFRNVLSSLLFAAIGCSDSFKYGDNVWRLLLFSASAFLIMSYPCSVEIACATDSKLFCYDQIDGIAEDYLNTFYDHPPIFTMKFNFENCKYHTNVQYGSWELASEKILLENKKLATLFKFKKSDYEPIDGFDKVLQEKIELTKNIFNNYDHSNSISPNIEYEIIDVDKDIYTKDELYTTSGFFKFMKSGWGKFLYFVLALFGIDVIIENICWLFVDVIDIDVVKKVSAKNDLETPAYTIRGQDKPSLPVSEDELPDFLSDEHYYQISGNAEGTRPAKRNLDPKIDYSNRGIYVNGVFAGDLGNINPKNPNAVVSLLKQILTDQTNDGENYTIADSEMPLLAINPIIPNMESHTETNDNENYYI